MTIFGPDYIDAGAFLISLSFEPLSSDLNVEGPQELAVIAELENGTQPEIGNSNQNRVGSLGLLTTPILP